MSSRVLQLQTNAVGQPQKQIVYGEVSMGQPAPTSFSSPLYVVIPDYSPDFFWTITQWPECHGWSLPKPGAACHLEFDNQGTLRCTWWAGAHSPSMPFPFCNKLASYLLA